MDILQCLHLVESEVKSGSCFDVICAVEFLVESVIYTGRSLFCFDNRIL